MIPQAAITAWRKQFPWPGNDQIEHDLVLSRAICELYRHPLIREHLAFRGGTALHKLFFDQPGRFSEDLDFVQITAQPIGALSDAIRSCLDPWLGKPSWKQGQGRFTLNYRFTTELQPVVTRKVKVEINTHEHFTTHGHITKPFKVENSWFNGEVDVVTYSLEELLGTKLRALYQRKKGRDLYDFWYAMQQFSTLDKSAVVAAFQQYMQFMNKKVSRAEFEKNLFEKRDSVVFKNDILPLLMREQTERYSIDEAYVLLQGFIMKLEGEAWRG